jgi:endonuclease/exonuclease/phosphatase family metal-dependent hydrolase
MHPRHFYAVLVALCLTAAAAAQSPIHPDEGRPQVLWQEARPLVGKVAFVAGKVIDVRTVGRVTFVNFDDQRPARFAGVIFEPSLANFPKPPREMYDGKLVRIRGTVSLYRDQPQIVVTGPDQIEVIDALPGGSAAITRRPQNKPGELVVASYNVLNLFDDHDDPYRADESTPPKPRRQMQRLAQSIVGLNADVIALEEVENRHYLERFVEVFLPDQGYEHVVLFEGNDTRGIDVALVSRAPIGPVRSHRHVTFPGPDGDERKFNRDMLAVTVEPVGGQPLELWVLHLKSNSGGREFAEPVRLAEAQEIRRMLDAELAEDPQARIVVLGDFNDTPESATLRTIIGEGDKALWSAHTDLADPNVLTYNEGEFKSMIDFLLCSPAMRQRYMKGSFRVPQGSVGATGSDHNPIVATFRVE